MVTARGKVNGRAYDIVVDSGCTSPTVFDSTTRRHVRLNSKRRSRWPWHPVFLSVASIGMSGRINPLALIHPAELKRFQTEDSSLQHLMSEVKQRGCGNQYLKWHHVVLLSCTHPCLHRLWRRRLSARSRSLEHAPAWKHILNQIPLTYTRSAHSSLSNTTFLVRCPKTFMKIHFVAIVRALCLLVSNGHEQKSSHTPKRLFHLDALWSKYWETIPRKPHPNMQE